MTRGSHNNTASDQFEITLRGLRLTAHEQNPEELHGMVVQWLNVGIRTQQHASYAVLFHETGDPIRSGKRPVRLRIPVGQIRVFQAAQARAQQAALRAGTFDISVIDDGAGERRLAAWFVSALCAVLIGLWGYIMISQAGGSWPAFVGWLTGNVLYAALWAIGVLSMPAMVLVLVWSMARTNVRSLRITPRGIDVELTNRQRVESGWPDALAIRRRLSGFRIRTRHGLVLRVASGRANFALVSQMNQLHAFASSRYQWRLGVIAFVLFQVGGILAAYLRTIGAGQFRGGAIGAYLFTAWGFPILIVMACSVAQWIAHVGEWSARRKRSKQRQIASSRFVS